MKLKAEPEGLSPLARGNLWNWGFNGATSGPIPARAGEPARSREYHMVRWAYPRSRGGTDFQQGAKNRGLGLSPLARGNLGFDHGGDLVRGPIPARAGEPLVLGLPIIAAGAYPRSRGGTDMANGDTWAASGLSPLARGNPGGHLGLGKVEGPIPARAGEPVATAAVVLMVRAYPRSRGGTCAAGSVAACAGGLSPLARGNRGRERSL